MSFNRGLFGGAAVIGLVVLVIMVIAVAVPITIQTVNSVTQPTSVVNESHTISIGGNTTVTNIPVYALSTIQIVNGSDYVLPAANYTFYPANPSSGQQANTLNGTVWFKPGPIAGWGTTALVTYSYEQGGFDPSTTDQTLLQILPLLIVLIALIGVFLVISNAF